MKTFSDILVAVDDFVWGPVMLILLVGTGIFLTIRTKALCWRNLPYALRSVLSKEARQKKGEGDVSPFSALTTALAATIGTGNIVGVATAMVSGGPGALVWMWISAAFGLTSKFSECTLAIMYREVNEKGEMSGGPMYTMKKGFRHKKLGSALGWIFALFAVIASFGIGNLTQGNSISSALTTTFGIPTWVTGIVITVLAMLIILGGIKSISKVSQVVVPLMAVFYILAGLIIIVGHIGNVPSGLAMIFRMAFSFKAVGGGLCGSLTASLAQALRFGVARGVFSNEAGMGSAAITAAAATTTDPVRQGYINMTGTFWDTIVVCTITGLCIASSGMLGSTTTAATGTYYIEAVADSAAGTDDNAPDANPGTATDSVSDTGSNATGDDSGTTSGSVSTGGTFNLVFSLTDKDTQEITTTRCQPIFFQSEKGEPVLTLQMQNGENIELTGHLNSDSSDSSADNNDNTDSLTGFISETYAAFLSSATWTDSDGNEYHFSKDGALEYRKLLIGAALTIAAFETVLGAPGGWLVCIGIALFAFSTILGWEYHGEKAFEYLFGTHRFNMIYRIVFSLIVYIGATTTLQIAWNFSDIANALMAIPNLICLLVMSGTIAKEMERYQKVLKKK